MLRSIIKIFILLSVVLTAHLLINVINHHRNQERPYTILEEAQKNIDTAYCFIGSSRIQHSINPEIIEEQLQTNPVFNLGVSGSTFFINNIMAYSIIKNNKTPKVVFIELCPIQKYITTDATKLSNITSIYPYESLSEMYQQNLLSFNTTYLIESIETYAFNKIFLYDKFEKIFNKKGNDFFIGGLLDAKEEYNSTDPFITYEEMQLKETDKDLTLYKKNIDYLIDMASKNNSKIIFMLPVTSMHQEEKDIIIPLFNALPDSIKVTYPKELIMSIRDVKYLKDENHLNGAGANKFSTLIAPIVKNIKFK